MGNRIQKGGLQVASELARFIDEELLPSLQLSGGNFWSGFESLIYQLSDRNQQLLHTRNQLQEKIDHWHRSHPGKIDLEKYKKFLREISYLIDVGDDFSITTENVDNEIAIQAGPQLVVPVKNARFALNAANGPLGVVSTMRFMEPMSFLKQMGPKEPANITPFAAQRSLNMPVNSWIWLAL